VSLPGPSSFPPVLDLLNHAYGLPARRDRIANTPCRRRKAGLMSASAQGVLENNVDWSLIEIGAGIGVALIIIDALLRRFTPRISRRSAVGLGIYLPTQSTMMVTIGSIVAWYFDRAPTGVKTRKRTKQLGVLLASD